MTAMKCRRDYGVAITTVVVVVMAVSLTVSVTATETMQGKRWQRSLVRSSATTSAAAATTTTTTSTRNGGSHHRSLIINGEAALPGRFPYFVAVGEYCGGALIAPDIVLTAGHCMPTRLYDDDDDDDDDEEKADDDDKAHVTTTRKQRHSLVRTKVGIYYFDDLYQNHHHRHRSSGSRGLREQTSDSEDDKAINEDDNNINNNSTMNLYSHYLEYDHLDIVETIRYPHWKQLGDDEFHNDFSILKLNRASSKPWILINLHHGEDQSRMTQRHHSSHHHHDDDGNSSSAVDDDAESTTNTTRQYYPPDTSVDRYWNSTYFTDDNTNASSSLGNESSYYSTTLPIPGQTLLAMGIGITDPYDGNARPETLQQVLLNAISNDECAKRKDSERGISYKGRILPSHFCTTGGGPDTADDKIRDSCAYDSGSPLIIPSSTGQPQDDLLVGLVSWGEGCADPTFPGVNSRVSFASDWIIETVCKLSNYPPDIYCKRPLPPAEPSTTGEEENVSNLLIRHIIVRFFSFVCFAVFVMLTIRKLLCLYNNNKNKTSSDNKEDYDGDSSKFPERTKLLTKHYTDLTVVTSSTKDDISKDGSYDSINKDDSFDSVNKKEDVES